MDACPAGIGDDTITLPAGIYTLTIAGTGEDLAATGDLDVIDNLTLTGADAATTLIDGGLLDRVIDVQGTVSLRIFRITITNGDVVGFGGGIRNNGAGATTVDTSVVRNNRASSFGGGISNDTNGTMFITNSTVSDNSANSFGGGLNNNSGGTMTVIGSVVSGNTAGGFGGGINNNFNGTVTVTRSTVSGNTGDSIGGINNNSSGTLVVTESIISGNTSNSGLRGGGIHNNFNGTVTIERTQLSGNLAIDGGGVNNNSSGTINIVNSTISGNTSSRTGSFGGGGGIYNNSSGPINVNSTTIVLNSSAGEGGGVKINSIGQVTLSNTVVANNTAPTGPDCVNTPTSAGHNLIGDASGCSFTPAVGDLVGTSGNPIDPFFGPLQDNDGPTETHALPLGSPAVDAGDNVACPATDQRGVSRPLDGGGGGPVTCDIGAFEFSFLPTPIPTLSQWGLIVLGGLLATVFVWRMVYPTRIGGWRRRIL